MGDAFFQNLLGVNRMPLGRTTVIGAPSKDVSAFFFAPDNSPGFAHVRVKPSDSGHQRVPAEPFVAGWSDGRKTPPADLAKLTTYLDEHDLSVSTLLELPPLSAATHAQYRKRMKELTERLGESIRMPDGKRIRVGDLLAVDAYRKLQQ